MHVDVMNQIIEYQLHILLATCVVTDRNAHCPAFSL